MLRNNSTIAIPPNHREKKITLQVDIFHIYVIFLTYVSYLLLKFLSLFIKKIVILQNNTKIISKDPRILLRTFLITIIYTNNKIFLLYFVGNIYFKNINNIMLVIYRKVFSKSDGYILISEKSTKILKSAHYIKNKEFFFVEYNYHNKITITELSPNLDILNIHNSEALEFSATPFYSDDSYLYFSPLTSNINFLISFSFKTKQFFTIKLNTLKNSIIPNQSFNYHSNGHCILSFTDGLFLCKLVGTDLEKIFAFPTNSTCVLFKLYKHNYYIVILNLNFIKIFKVDSKNYTYTIFSHASKIPIITPLITKDSFIITISDFDERYTIDENLTKTEIFKRNIVPEIITHYKNYLLTTAIINPEETKKDNYTFILYGYGSIIPVYNYYWQHKTFSKEIHLISTKYDSQFEFTNTQSADSYENIFKQIVAYISSLNSSTYILQGVSHGGYMAHSLACLLPNSKLLLRSTTHKPLYNIKLKKQLGYYFRENSLLAQSDIPISKNSSINTHILWDPQVLFISNLYYIFYAIFYIKQSKIIIISNLHSHLLKDANQDIQDVVNFEEKMFFEKI